MKFSVIVPVYKVEQYLAECIESILAQSFQDFELLLIDDGSPDRCPQICDGYAGADGRIRAIHQTNTGPSEARNAGISAAEGDYIVFVDGDDVMCAEALQRIDACIDLNGQPDMLIGNIIFWDEAGERIRFDSKAFMDKQTNRSILELNQLYAKRGFQLPWAAYNSIYKKEFLYSNGLVFQRDLICAEDVDFYFKAIQADVQYILTDIPLIKYRLNREGSIITTPTVQAVWGKLTVFSNIFRQADVFPDTALMRGYFADYFARSLVSIPRLAGRSDREKCYRFVEENKSILRCVSSHPQYILGKIVWTIFGIRTGAQILCGMNEVRKRVAFRIRKFIRLLRGG